MQQWEYVVLNQTAGQDKFWLGYSAPEDVDDADYPNGAFGMTLGELGGLGWELVSVTETVHDNGARDTRLYFKRPHDPKRDLRK